MSKFGYRNPAPVYFEDDHQEPVPGWGLHPLMAGTQRLGIGAHERGRAPVQASAGWITFASQQLSEHALFLGLGLEEPKLKAQAHALHAEWETFRRAMATSKAVHAGMTSAELVRLAGRLRAFKVHVLGRLNAGEWLGWLFPAFVSHVLRELDYFVAKATGKALPRGKELCAWREFMQEHAAFAAHLLDPREAGLIREARKHMATFAALQHGCADATPTILQVSRRAGSELDKYLQSSGIGTPRVKSVIHPVLAAHVVREGQMFLKVLGEMGSRRQ